MPVRILVADDSATMRKVVQMTFAGEDAEVIAVDGGQAAIERAESWRPDVVLADVSMPVNAYDVARALKANPATSSVVVVALASAQNPYDAERGRSSGIDDHVVKPFETQHLIDRVAQLLARPRAPVAATAPAPAVPSATATMAAVTPGPPPSAVVSPPSTVGPGPVAARTPSPLKTTVAFGPPLKPGAAPAATPAAGPAPAGPAGSAPAAPRPVVASTASANPSPAAQAPRPAAPVVQLGASAMPASTTAGPSSAAATSAPAVGATRSDAVGRPAASAAPAPATGGAPPARPAAPATATPQTSPAAHAPAAAVSTEGLPERLAGLGLTPVQVEAVLALSRDVIERVVWEVVPDLAEAIIREEIRRLTS
ncbi:MAG: response regulator [Myxococcales bacterium]|nr:response regulator [Myxococcales bacterium]